MSQRITVSGNCCWHLCHAGKLRSWSFHASASVGVHWQTSPWDITICSDRALCEFTVDVLDWMSVHDCGLVDDETVAMSGNITAALDYSTADHGLHSHFCDDEPASFFSSSGGQTWQKRRPTPD